MRDIWDNYRSEVFFGFVLVVITVVSTILARYIPDRLFDHVFTPVFNVATIAVAFTGAWNIFRHTDGMRMRRLWGYVLLVWGLGDLFYLVCYLVAPMQVMNMGAEHITTFELLFGNLLGWVMVLYPMEVLRPGWLRPKTVAWQLLPLFAMVALDYILPLNLWPVIALYPYALLVQTLSHIRAYRIWCENNYSSMDNIEVQWVIRYCIMLFIIGANYMYINISHEHTRAFTQEWFVIFMLVYSTEQILFRKDPWDKVQGDEVQGTKEDVPSEEVVLLEQWMETEKPYLNPNFKLIDLQAVLPMNRTYLSELINKQYGCSFYQYVGHYRVEEAKRLMTENPETRINEVAVRCGFSSPGVFTRIFVKEVGVTPKEWEKEKLDKK